MGTDVHPLKPYRSVHKDGVIQLIASVLEEYGQGIALDHADADLLDIPAHYAGRGGAFVVLEGSGREVLGTHAALPVNRSRGVLTFRRLYLHPSQRGTGAAIRLMNWTVDWAVAHRFHRVEFWSDVLFSRAHRFFLRYGFHQTGEIRAMYDAGQAYREYRFVMDLVSSCGKPANLC